MKINIELLKNIISVVVFVELIKATYTQTGPGGVGNSNGSSGQLENVIWFIADSLSLSDTELVAIWNDLSGNSNDASQVTALDQLQYGTSQINGLSAVVFVGRRRTDGGFKVFFGGTSISVNQNFHLHWANSDQFRPHHWWNDLQTDMVNIAEIFSDVTNTSFLRYTFY